jgi:hypothetical protein
VNVSSLALSRGDREPGKFDAVAITLPKIQGDPAGLDFQSDGQFFHVAGGTLRLVLVQEVHVSNALTLCEQTVWLQHERGHVRDNEAIMPRMDQALRADEQFPLIMVQGQEFPISQRDQVKKTSASGSRWSSAT